MLKIKILFFFLIIFQVGNAQLIMKPNYGQKSHETLTIDKLEINTSFTVITLSIVNKIENASFCADKNIYIKNSIGTEMYQLIKTENIPSCPQNYNFKSINEKLTFRLFFPPISSDIKYLDLVESCDVACFSFSGIILSNPVNTLIEKAFLLYSSSQKENSAKAFEQIIYQTNDYPYAFIYFSAIRIWSELGNQEKVSKLKSELSFSSKVDKNTLH